MTVASVELTYYICRWCGAPYGIPSALAANGSVEARCPTGHRHADGQTYRGEIEQLRTTAAALRGELVASSVAQRNLRRRIARLEKRLRKFEGQP